MVLSHLNYGVILVCELTARYGQPLYFKLIMSMKYVCDYFLLYGIKRTVPFEFLAQGRSEEVKAGGV